MKVAIVLSGHMRCWETVFPNFKTHFIDKYQPDIFIHTWADEGWWVPQEGVKGVDPQSVALDAQKAYDTYRPVSMTVEDFDPYLPIFAKRVEAFTNFYHRPRNIVSMFYKMGAAFHLLEQHVLRTGTKYDLIIRMRPDMLIQTTMPDFDPEKFYTLAHRNHMGGGTGDMFQIGSYENVRQFVKIGCELEELYAQTGLLCPHVLSVQHIKNLGLPWEEFTVHKTIQHTPQGQYGNG
jgi:hypothetical protein